MDASSSAPIRRLSAVWFADIVGFTSLAGTDEGAAFKLVTILQKVARQVAEEQFGGRIVKFIGDAALAEFSSTDAAVRAAIALQESFDKEAKAAGRAAELRIGVHLGEVIATADGDIYGDGVNTASRLQGEASPGKVLISEDVWRQLRTRPEFQFQSLGEVELRGITARVAVFDVLFGASAAMAHDKASGAGAATIAALSAALSRTHTASGRNRSAVWAVLGLLVIGGGAAGLYYAWRATAASAGTEAAVPGPQPPPKAQSPPGDSEPQGTQQAGSPPLTTPTGGQTAPPTNQVANRATGQGSGGRPTPPPPAERQTDPGRAQSSDAGRGQPGETGRASAPTSSAPSGTTAEPPAGPYVADPVRERDLAVTQAVAALDSVVHAVGRGSSAELSRALPLTVGDLAEFEQIFSRATAPVRGTVLTPRVTRIDTSGAEIWFLLMMEFTDRQGAPGSVTLPLRAFVARGSRGWRIDTVGLRN